MSLQFTSQGTIQPNPRARPRPRGTMPKSQVRVLARPVATRVIVPKSLPIKIKVIKDRTREIERRKQRFAYRKDRLERAVENALERERRPVKFSSNKRRLIHPKPRKN